jgi:hypothetical protein
VARERGDKQQGRPRRVESRVMGVLKLDPELGWYEGRRTRGKLAYGVCVDTPEHDSGSAVGAAIEHASSIVLRVERELPKIRDVIADELLDVYNEGWRELRPRLSAAGFKKRHKLEALVVTSRRVTLYFACSRLFGKHCVEVRLSPRLAVREVCISG